MARAMMYTAQAPELANAYCVLQAVDILNTLPTTANPADPASNVTGFSPHLLYYNSAPPLDQLYAFGSFCTVHLDDDHVDASRPHVRAASCIYLCRAHHAHSQGHIVWEYDTQGKGRKLIVPEISRHIWNYFPMRSGPDKHLSNFLTFVAPDVHADSHADAAVPRDVSPIFHMDASTDPMCPQFPDSQVILDAGEKLLEREQQPQSAYKTRQFDHMNKNIGAKVRRVLTGPTDLWTFSKAQFALSHRLTNMTWYTMITIPRKCRRASSSTIHCLPKRRPRRTLHESGGINGGRNSLRAIALKDIAIIRGQTILLTSAPQIARKVSPNQG